MDADVAGVECDHAHSSCDDASPSSAITQLQLAAVNSANTQLLLTAVNSAITQLQLAAVNSAITQLQLAAVNSANTQLQLAAVNSANTRNIASQHSPTMRIKPITQSTGKDHGHRLRTRPSYQVDQGSCTYPQGRSSSYESRRGQLSVDSCLQPHS